MSSIQDRIRRLQSADNPPDQDQDQDQPPPAPTTSIVTAAQNALSHPKVSVSTLTSRFTSETAPSSTAPPLHQVSSLKTVLENTTTSNPRQPQSLQHRLAPFTTPSESAPSANALHARITRLEAGIDPDQIAARVNHLENHSHPSKLPAPSPGHHALADAKSAFEQKTTQPDTKNVRARAAAFQSAPQPDQSPAEAESANVIAKTSVFEARPPAETSVTDRVTTMSQRAGVFERSTVSNDADETPKDVAKKLDVPRSKALEMHRRAELQSEADGVQPADGKADEKVASLLSSRAAMFEEAEAAESRPLVVARKVSPRVDGKKVNGEGDVEKVGGEKGKKSLVEELHEVKEINRDLISRLIELTGSFKRLEKSREELQGRISRLEKMKN